jgi:hypothetical protein
MTNAIGKTVIEEMVTLALRKLLSKPVFLVASGMELIKPEMLQQKKD